MKDLEHFDQLHYDLQQMVAPIKDLEVSNQESCDLATTFLRQAKRMLTTAQDRRKEVVGPYNDRVKQINLYVEKICQPLVDAEKQLKTKLLEYERVLEKNRERMRQLERIQAEKREQQAQEKIRLAREDAESEALFAQPAEAERLQAQVDVDAERIAFEAKKAHWDRSKEIANTKVRGTTLRWVHQIENDSLIPREFLMPDEKKIREYYLAEVKKEHTPQIPGVKIFQEKSISVR